MAQTYPDIPATKAVRDSRQDILDRDEAVRSAFSGTTFPSANLVVGMFCFRTDLGQIYELTATSPVTWTRIPLGVPVPLAQGGTGASDAATARTNLGLAALAVKNTVASADIDNAAVQTAKLQDASVTTVKIADGQVTTAKLADGQVTTAKLGDAQVTTVKLQDSSVTTAKIADGQVTYTKLIRSGDAGQVLTSNGTGADASFQSLPAGVPAGIVVPYAGTTEPSGWLFAAGQAVSRAAYAALFAALGTTYGAGDGSTTFTLPDLRGRVAAGRDNMNGTAANRLTAGGAGIGGTTLGAAGGTETHVLTAAQMPSHMHSYAPPGGGAYVSTDIHENGASVITGSSAANTGSAGSGAAHPNAQPTLVLNYIIKT